MSAAGLLGPGRLVLVTGPSGAGKDSVLADAQLRLGGDGRFVFPKRVITRPPSAFEDHGSLSRAAFDAAAARGAFALTWQAHGLAYGIPVAIDDAIAGGAVVVCNISRSVISAARARYADVLSVEITAPRDVLRARLLARGREGADDVEQRLARYVDTAVAGRPNVVISNDGALSDAVDAFIAAVSAE